MKPSHVVENTETPSSYCSGRTLMRLGRDTILILAGFGVFAAAMAVIYLLR